MNMAELLNPADEPMGEMEMSSVPRCITSPSILVVEITEGDASFAARSLVMLNTKGKLPTLTAKEASQASLHDANARSPVLVPAYAATFHMSPVANKMTSPVAAWNGVTVPRVDTTPPLLLQPPLKRRLSSIDAMLNDVEMVSAESPRYFSQAIEPATSIDRPDYCSVTGCLRRPSLQNLGKCAVHKGMKLCQIEGCFRPVQSRGCCKSHGGGARCKHPDCTKGAISKGRCRSHGGGTRCAVPECLKWAQRFGCCVRHSKTVIPKPQLV